MTLPLQARKRVKLTYPPALLDKPVIYSLIKQFDLVTNIREASFNTEEGWLIVDLIGSPAALEQALIWVREQGAHVEPLSMQD